MPTKKMPGTNSVNKRFWQDAEDAALREAVAIENAEEKGMWSRVSDHVKGRSAKQCRERWTNHVDPCVNKTPFSEAEDKAIIRMAVDEGDKGKWAEISKRLPGYTESNYRTDNQVKNRWYATLRCKRAGDWTEADDTAILEHGAQQRPWSELIQARWHADDCNPPTEQAVAQRHKLLTKPRKQRKRRRRDVNEKRCKGHRTGGLARKNLVEMVFPPAATLHCRVGYPNDDFDVETQDAAHPTSSSTFSRFETSNAANEHTLEFMSAPAHLSFEVGAASVSANERQFDSGVTAHLRPLPQQLRDECPGSVSSVPIPSSSPDSTFPTDMGARTPLRAHNPLRDVYDANTNDGLPASAASLCANDDASVELCIGSGTPMDTPQLYRMFDRANDVSLLAASRENSPTVDRNVDAGADTGADSILHLSPFPSPFIMHGGCGARINLSPLRSPGILAQSIADGMDNNSNKTPMAPLPPGSAAKEDRKVSQLPLSPLVTSGKSKVIA